MTVTIYQIPANLWYGVGIPPDKLMIDERIVSQGETYEEALRELVIAINQDTVDDVNCYLYIHEETE